MISVYVTLDADLSPVELFPSQGFRSSWYRVTEEAEVESYGAPIGDYAAAEIEHAPGALNVLQAEDLDRFRILRLEIEEAPEGQRIEGYAFALDGDEITVTASYGALPSPRRLIAKDVIMQRLDDEQVAAAQAALLRRPVLFGRWFNKDWPEVYADDEDMVAVLTAIGADVETITAP